MGENANPCPGWKAAPDGCAEKSARDKRLIIWIDSANGLHTLIFGTDGSSTHWRWDGFMDHNVCAVPLTTLTTSNQIFTATYHLYV